MKRKQRIMRAVFVDDDEGPDFFRPLMERDYPGWDVTFVDSVLDATVINADVYFMDISAVCPNLGGSVHKAWSPIASLVDLHPGGTFVLTSVHNKTTCQPIIDLVKEHTGVELIYMGYRNKGSFHLIMNQLLDDAKL